MPETLLTPSSIKLFGRVMSSLQYSDDTKAVGNNNFLQRQLSYTGDLKTMQFLGNILNPGPGNRTVSYTVLLGYHNLVPDVVPGMLVTGIVPGLPLDQAQAFAPGTYIASVTLHWPANAAGAAAARAAGQPPPAQGRAARGRGAAAGPIVPPPVHIPIPAQFTVSADPLVPPGAQAADISITAWSPAINIARIYAFSFEGAIYTLPRPSLFFVHGPGDVIDTTGETRGRPGHTSDKVWPENLGRTSLDESGVIAREWEFSSPSSPEDRDLRYWEYEKGDFLMRLDTEAGPLEQILLAAALRAGADMADRSGANLGVRSGANLSGANLSGANLSGANLAGANLSGANLRNR
jgi:Pentapeptide repeats (8 copies)